MKIELVKGNIYYLRFFTAPKVWTGEWFECLLTDQRIRKKGTRVSQFTGHNLLTWPHEIYRIERFRKLLP